MVREDSTFPQLVPRFSTVLQTLKISVYLSRENCSLLGAYYFFGKPLEGGGGGGGGKR